MCVGRGVFCSIEFIFLQKMEIVAHLNYTLYNQYFFNKKKLKSKLRLDVLFS